MFSTKEPILILFDEIDRDDHGERIIFYEENTEVIFALDDDKLYYFNYHYLKSLFATEKYASVLTEIDDVIEYVFLNNINYIPNRTYEGLLYMKASASFEMYRYEEAINIGEQLVGMHPENLLYRKFIERAYRSYYNFTSSGIRLTALVLIFCSAIVSAIIWFINNNVQEGNLTQAFFVIMAPCLLALGLLGGAHFYNYLKSLHHTDLLVAKKKQKKSSKAML